ncbi:MAG TPA: hypothetical protein K8V84_17990 [Nocardiopsis listeri]|uniref:hypothetical protein n=1 Tax=Nocardiopsis listeri TaxID=53440 RepID=UPI001DDBD207|nr:hypothetical protein [Nocardiopsis listeri]HJE60377.1 hypothetical protein [Nocardiopsis listeri]
MPPVSPDEREPESGSSAGAPASEGGGTTRVRRQVEEVEEQGPTFGDTMREAFAALGRVRTDRVFQLGMLIVAVATVLKVYVLGESYFVEDDFLFFAAANSSDLTPEFLLELHKGHFMPGAMFLIYLQNAFGAYHWVSAAGTMLLLQVAVILVFFRLLWELFGRRLALLVPLTVYALAPLTIPVLGWWAAALNAVPFQLSVALALLFTVRYLRTGVTQYVWWVVAAVVFGMLFSVKAMLLPPLLLAFAVAFLYPGGPIQAVRYAFWLDRRFWSGMVGLTLGYLVLYLVRQNAGTGEEGASVPVWDTAAELMRRMLTEVFPVGVLGGPFEWSPITPTGGLLDPIGVVLIGAWVVLALIVVASLRVRRGAWRAWALLLGYLVFADAIPTVIARGDVYGEVGSDPRYVADAALVFALALALAFLVTKEERAREYTGNTGEERDPRRRLLLVRPGRVTWALALVVTLIYAGSAGYSTYTYARTLSGDRLRSYMDNVRTSLAEVPEDAGIYSRPVPDDIVLEWNGPRRLSSYVLTPLADRELAERMYDPEPAATAHVFDDEGNLVVAGPPSQVNSFVPAEDDECMDNWDGLMSWSVWEFGGIEQVATIGYTSQEDANLVVVVGGEEVRTELPAAPDGGFWYVPVSERGDTFTLYTDPDKTCVTWSSLGPLAPAGDLEEADSAEEEPEEGAEGDGSAEDEG